MRTSAYLAGLAVFGLAAVFHAQPARAAIDCNHCEAVYRSCIFQGHDETYCLENAAPACLKECSLGSVNDQQDPFDLGAATKAFAMNKVKPAVSLLAAVQ